MSRITAGSLPTHPGQAHVLHVVDHLADVAQPHRRTVFVRHNHLRVAGGGEDLVIRADGVGLARAVKAAFGLVDVILSQRVANVFHAKSLGRDRRRVDTNADRRLLVAFNRHQTHAADFAEFLGQDGVGKGRLPYQSGRRLGGDFERENWGVGGVHLAISGRAGHFSANTPPAAFISGLHNILGGRIDIADPRTN